MTLSVPLGETKEVKWVNGSTTHDLEKLYLGSTLIWEKVINFTGTSEYDPITKRVTHTISGDRVNEFTKWSHQSVRRSDGLDTGEIFVESGTSTYKVVGVPDDGTYDVTFKGYVDGTVRGTTTATVTVATPFIEITSVVELTPPAPTPPTYQTVTFNVTPGNFGGGQYVGRYYRETTSSGTVGSLSPSNAYVNGNRVWYCGWAAIDRVNSESWRDGSEFILGLTGDHVTGKAWDENPFAGITVLGQDFFIAKHTKRLTSGSKGTIWKWPWRGGTTIPATQNLSSSGREGENEMYIEISSADSAPHDPAIHTSTVKHYDDVVSEYYAGTLSGSKPVQCPQFGVLFSAPHGGWLYDGAKVGGPRFEQGDISVGQGGNYGGTGARIGSESNFQNEATVSEIVSWRLGPHRANVMNFFGWVNNSSPHQKPNSFQGGNAKCLPYMGAQYTHPSWVANTPVTVHY